MACGNRWKVCVLKCLKLLIVKLTNFAVFLEELKWKQKWRKSAFLLKQNIIYFFAWEMGANYTTFWRGVMEFMGTGAATQKHFMFNIRRGKTTGAIYTSPFSLSFLIGLFRSKRGVRLGSCCWGW
jgi:hypothetical protein